MALALRASGLDTVGLVNVTGRNLSTLTPTIVSGLILSSSITDFWWKGHCSLYAGFPIKFPRLEKNASKFVQLS